MSSQKQRRILDRGVDVLVATPGRLWDIIQDVSDPRNLIQDERFDEYLLLIPSFLRTLFTGRKPRKTNQKPQIPRTRRSRSYDRSRAFRGIGEYPEAYAS